MMRLYLVVAVVAGLSAGCSANTSTQEREPVPAMRMETVSAPVAAVSAAAVLVPDNPADRGIRRDLTLAIAHDADLHNRAIRFIVTNGDVRVSGVVGTETARRKINGLAMNIEGVKSVANALRVAE